MATTVYHHVFLIVLLMLRCFTLSGGQNCDSNINVDNIERRGDLRTERGRQAIVPNSMFTCSGRITRIRASSSQHSINDQDPYYQLWRPSSTNPNVYTRVGSVQLTDSHASQQSGYWIIDISFSGNGRIEFQAGDVIGHFDPGPDPRFRLWSISTTGYITYSNSALDQADMFDISSAEYTITNQQPLIQISYDIRCDTILSNGAMLCSPGMGYQGDTCSFSCNTGYDLIGSTTRTCQSNGQWSGAETICTRVHCTSLPTPVYGTIDCPLGDDNVLSYEDICSLICNIGYVLIGSNTRVCQSDGSWSGTDAICTRVCLAPLNGQVDCGSGVVNIGLEGESCTISCHPGYILQGGLSSGVCEDTGSWSGGELVCVPLNCSNRSTVLPEGVNIIETPSCGMSYQSQCTLSCDAGFTGNNVTYMCNVTSPNMVDWVPIGGADVMCVRVHCSDLNNGILSCPNGTITGVFEDTCTFSCNLGYELQGPSNGTCLADQSWSEGDPICVALNCSTSPPIDNSQLRLPCDTQYQSTCTTVCVGDYTGGGGSYTCVVTDVATNTVGWRGTTSCRRVQCPQILMPENGAISCSLINDPSFSYEDTCSFTCNTGYELTGSPQRTCQSDGSWNGSPVSCTIMECPTSSLPLYSMLAESCSSTYQSMCDLQCKEGFYGSGDPSYVCDVLSDGSVMWVAGGEGWSCIIAATCIDLPTPSNGSNNCSSTNQPLQYQDTCTFQCDDGYELEGSVMRQCEASGEWSGTSTQCNILHCPDITTVVANSRPCDTSYTSTCMVECEDGYDMSGNVQYSCDLNSTEVTWTLLNGSDVTCSPVPCNNLTDPENGNVTCPSTTSVFQDTCTYYCNRGYQLNGNRQPSCTADGIWSGEPVTCTILTCNDPTMEIENSQSVGDCSMIYGSRCLLNCSSFYIASGNGEHVCDDVNVEEASVMWRSVGEPLVCISSATGSSKSGTPAAVIGGTVGGVVVFLLIIVLCIIVVFVRWSHKKSTYAIDKDRVYDEPSANTAVFISPNPAYKTMKSNSKEYDYIKDNEVPQFQDGIKMESNPSYGLSKGLDTTADVIIQPNPSYGVSSPQRKISEDQCGDTIVKMEDNPSYGTTSKESNANLGSDIIMTPNPSYNSMAKSIPKEKTSDYDYVRTDIFMN